MVKNFIRIRITYCNLNFKERTLPNPLGIIHLERTEDISTNQEFESRWMSVERKSIWTVHVINECYVYCFSLR